LSHQFPVTVGTDLVTGTDVAIVEVVAGLAVVDVDSGVVMVEIVEFVGVDDEAHDDKTSDVIRRHDRSIQIVPLFI
jgi:hypothetical protein